MRDEMSLEDQLKRLEEIVKRLEVNELPLEDAISLFEEGASIVKSAQNKLAKDEVRIQKIVKELEGGPVLEDYEPEE
ncbi:MAG: exodeoxyribonuclease VII small subunit [Candidatus Glassbacteria bacterium]